MSDPSANSWFSDLATWLTDGLILLDGWLNYVSDSELAKELLKPKDWIVGVFSALVVLVLVSRMVPKLRIETRILYELQRDTYTYSIKVVNKRHSWLASSGNAIDNRAELHLVRLPSPVAGEKVVSIDLVRSDPLIIRHRRFFRKSGRSEYIFDVKQEQTVRGEKAEPL